MHRKAQFFPLGDTTPEQQFPFVNWAIIAANIIAFVISYAALDAIISTYGFTPAHFSIKTVFTSMFLHASIAHIAGNLWFLYIFGDNVEDAFGHFTYLVFYLLAGVAATFAHLLFNLGSTVPSIGASGAISGVLGAYLVFYPGAGVYVAGGQRGRISAKLMIVLWFVFQLASGLVSFLQPQAGGGIAFFAHVGGFIFGVIVAWIWKRLGGAPSQPAMSR
jgi:membrane associated rhomboid family serine protease